MASLEIGIIGLPNCGKTTIFNALTGAGVVVQPYAATEVSVNTVKSRLLEARDQVRRMVRRDVATGRRAP